MDFFTTASCLATCVVIILMISSIWPRLWSRQFYEKASTFPGPPALPIIGNTHLLMGSTEDTLLKFMQLNKSYPSPYRLWAGNYLIIVGYTPEYVKVVLNSSKTIDKGLFYKFGEPYLDTGLVTASGDKSQVRRRLMQPTFHTTVLQSFVEIIAARSAVTVEEMGRNLEGEEFDVLDYTSRNALHAICETTMGVNLTTQSESIRYADVIDKAGATLSKRTVTPWLYPDFIFNRTQLGKEQKELVKYLHDFTDRVIQAKRKHLLEQKLRPGLADDEDVTGKSVPRKKILLDYLMELSDNGEVFSDEDLREEVMTAIVAGSDTIATAASFAMLMLSIHPEVQEKAYQEQREIYEDNDGEELNLTPKDLARMIYLNRVIKETLRLFPAVPFVIRSVTGDLKIGEHIVPDGSQVLASIIDLHRNEKYWKDPLEFDPDRFLPEEERDRDPHAYVPFSGGPRSCIGIKYAMMSMKIFLATILRKYVLKKDVIVPVKDVRLKWEIVLRPAVPITLRIQKRT